MKVTIKVEQYVCERCGYIWISRIPTLPKQCPNCKSIIWNIRREDKEEK